MWRYTRMVLERERERIAKYITKQKILWLCVCHKSDNNNNDRLTAFDPGQPG